MRYVRWATALLIGIAACHAALAADEAITGVPRIVDGDTIRFGETRICGLQPGPLRISALRAWHLYALSRPLKSGS